MMLTFVRPTRKVDTCFIHCSASDAIEADDVSVIRQWHLARGWRDVGYHFFIKKNGTVQPGRDLELIPAAQYGYNTGTIAICCHGLKVELFTSAQFKSLLELAREINKSYGSRRLKYRGHCEVSAKSCPVFDYRRVLGLCSSGYMIHNPNTKTQGVTPAQKNAVLAIGSRGPRVEQLQQYLNYQADARIAEDGVFGRNTMAAVNDAVARGLLHYENDTVVGFAFEPSKAA
jgi:hypothetical protein